MKEKLNDILESIKREFGGLVTLKWSEIGEMLSYTLVLIFLISLIIVLKILLLPYTLVKKLFKKCLWWQNFMLWFTVYIAYKWDKMPNYKIWKVIETRRNGYKGFTQKTLNRWAYWIYKDFRELYPRLPSDRAELVYWRAWRLNELRVGKYLCEFNIKNK